MTTAMLSAGTDHRRRLGRLGEDLALAHMCRLGFELLERNYRSRSGEIDLIVMSSRILVFVEVKCRIGTRADPFLSLGPAKRRQVRRLAARWLSTAPCRPVADVLRFDAIGVTVGPRGELLDIRHVPDAF
jgi:putative endonuclease